MDKTINPIYKVNPVYKWLLPTIIVCYFLFNSNIYYTLASAIFFHQFISLFLNVGKKIPLRNLAGTMFSLNYLLAPALMFFWLNPFVGEDYRMRGDATDYFIYAIPAIIMFLAGLYVFAKKNEEEINLKKIRKILDQFPSLPLQFIIIGLIASFSMPYIPSQLQFIINSLAYLKFIGMFLSILDKRPLNIIYLVITYGALLVSSLTSSMFNDLLNMLFFLGFYLSVKYKPSPVIKLAGLIAGLIFLGFIQSIKFALREQVTNTFADLQKIPAIIQKVQKKKLSTDEKLANVTFRLSQGWVTSSSMVYYHKGGYELQNGDHSATILRLAVMPRVLDPDRMVVGDGTFFNAYSGHMVASGTSIALGILADGYIDYGQNGIFIVLVFGLIFNGFIKLYGYLDGKFGLAKVFIPICFFYIRPDTDTFSSLGAAIKTTFVITIILFITYKFYIQNKIDLENQPVSS